MNNKMDKVFKDKLESHQLTPSPAAWDKLERELVKKNKAYVWMRVAAVLALFSLATVVAINWPAANTPGQEVTKQENTEPPQSDPVNESETPAAVEENTDAKERHPAPTQKLRPTPQQQGPVEDEKPLQAEVEQEQQQPDDVVETHIPELVADITPVIEQTPAVAIGEEPEAKPIVIVYTLPALPRKEAAPVEEKKTGIQRVLEVATNVKNADGPFGDLREAKNDLFALEFRRDKDKNKNNN